MFNPFTTGNPFLGTKLLGFSVGRGSGALEGLNFFFFFFFQSSGGWGNIKLKLTTLPRIFRGLRFFSGGGTDVLDELKTGINHRSQHGQTV